MNVIETSLREWRKEMDSLWCDLKTDEERAEFLRSGRAWETGIIAQALVDEVAEAFLFRSKASKQVVSANVRNNRPLDCIGIDTEKQSIGKYDSRG